MEEPPSSQDVSSLINKVEGNDADDDCSSPSVIRATQDSARSLDSNSFIPYSDDEALVNSKRIRHGESRSPRFLRRALLGGIVGGLLTMCLLGVIYVRNPSVLEEDFMLSSSYLLRGESPPTGVLSYLKLFAQTPISPIPLRKRKLSESSFRDPQLVIAGKLSVEYAPCNIAQYNLKSKQWSLTERIQLSLYNSYSGGEVYSLLANHTTQTNRSDRSETEDAKR